MGFCILIIIIFDNFKHTKKEKATTEKLVHCYTYAVQPQRTKIILMRAALDASRFAQCVGSLSITYGFELGSKAPQASMLTATLSWPDNEIKFHSKQLIIYVVSHLKNR